MFVKRYGNVTVSVFFLLLSVAYHFLAKALPPSKVMRIGPSFVPELIAGLTFALAATLLFVSLKKLKAPSPPPAATPGKSDSEYGRVLLTIIAFSLYVFLFEGIGFILATFLYLSVQIPIMAPKEKRNIPVFIGVAAIGTCLIYYIFKFHLNVMLPAGIIPW